MSLIQKYFSAISESVVINPERIKKTLNNVLQMDTFKIKNDF